MRGVVMYSPGDIRVGEREDPRIIEPTDAIVRLTATCICGSDLWPYRGVEPAIAALLTAAWVALHHLVASYQGLQYKCIAEGPYRDSPPYPLLSEAVEVHGYSSLFPLGRACDWERDGAGFVTALPDWTATVPMLTGVALIIIGAVIYAASRIRRAGRDTPDRAESRAE